ncbi:hypothetical protein V501_09353 [Pseudogymnoascus sp. VKM F-4519 (FW-2642)]|nr:hypothetical protein V501_09353 [Pseudogymnoascus sp. VKM F-4519 (FW-2642)]
MGSVGMPWRSDLGGRVNGNTRGGGCNNDMRTDSSTRKARGGKKRGGNSKIVPARTRTAHLLQFAKKVLGRKLIIRELRDTANSINGSNFFVAPGDKLITSSLVPSSLPVCNSKDKISATEYPPLLSSAPPEQDLEMIMQPRLLTYQGEDGATFDDEPVNELPVGYQSMPWSPIDEANQCHSGDGGGRGQRQQNRATTTELRYESGFSTRKAFR